MLWCAAARGRGLIGERLLGRLLLGGAGVVEERALGAARERPRHLLPNGSGDGDDKEKERAQGRPWEGGGTDSLGYILQRAETL